MTTLDDLPFSTDGAAPANPAAPGPRKCYRHQWREFATDFDLTTLESSGSEMRCARCGKVKADAAIVSRVRRASARGFRTSADLAAYLGGQNVDKLGWPWDVQGRGYRIQSKRLADRPSAAALARLIEAIPVDAETIRAVFYVGPRARLTSGLVTVNLRDWADWHDWLIPQDARPFHTAGRLLLEMPLPTFRDIHIGRTPA